MGWKAIAVIHMRDDNGLNQGRNSRVMREGWLWAYVTGAYRTS